ncbi:hypothetical protein PTSG_09884 [Salpingoeca rosetta]|uniref:V-type proton ATPase subunit G n=1 Tax=Salpingoeca rosetta (strain ATCC 50818 / BSB-021) TaxID=946362 RepID=F2UNE8_SALR5|nr:uncharacterized protein PTSG_09884 [Salpingoeca rosetta]EGD79153.1 hypothetical protein PTSG_09884 [Salpingoeca rosetta]|eukprot:XP_004989238.1 hypothetical protein PTSG_09884 [Salpingoeca rosetta]
MSGVQSAGVQRLVEAEKAAASKIKQARNEKAQMMKQARTEAQKRIEVIRSEQEKAYQEKVHAREGSGNVDTASINKNTEEKLATLKSNVEQNRGDVIEMLLDAVCKVEARVHENFNPK